VQVSAQSWHGLAADEDERYRVAATAEGGIWLLRTPHPEPATALAGSRRVVDTTRRLLGAVLWSREGLSRERRTPVVDADLIRGLGVGQAAYIYRGGVTFVQVKRLVAAPAALPRPIWPAGHADGSAVAAGAPDRPGRPAPDGAGIGPGVPARRPGPPPDAGSLLDEAFGQEGP
jgi:hypothetical protein